MDINLPPKIAIVASEALLSLYPQLIKQNEFATLQLQILIRVLVITTLAYVYIKTKDRKNIIVPTVPSFKDGFFNAVHITASYIAFQRLGSADALTLFYTYPLWNLVLSKIFLNESIDTFLTSMLIVGFIGVLLILRPNMSSKNLIGVTAALIAAITESIMYVAYHDPKPQTITSQRLFELYAGTIPFVLISLLFGREFFVKKELSSQTKQKLIIQIILFNVFIGFGMHLWRAWGARKTSANVFSILSLSGVLFAFLYQMIFEKQQISMYSFVGAGLIFISGVVVILKNFKTQKQKEKIENAENLVN
jgi:drug/metabolite transporter (DMT)-like permease